MCRQRRFRWLARQTPGARRDCPPTAAFSFVAPIARLLQIEQLEQRRMLATFMVTSNVDGGAGSLREAVAMANDTDGADTITFDGAVFTGGDASLIRLTQGELEITDTLTIDGSTGAAVTITGDANDDDVTDENNITDVAASFENNLSSLDDNSRILNFSSVTGDLTLASLTITGGRTTGDNSDEIIDDTHSGGAIRSRTSGSLTIGQSIISGNGTAGQFAFGGAIFADRVTLTESTVSENSTFGISAYGGGIFAYGDVTLTESTVSGNVTLGHSGFGGGILSYGAVTLAESNVSDNITLGDSADGGGIFAGGALTLTKSAISGNVTLGDFADGGGIFAANGATLSLSTVSGNSTNGYQSEGGAIAALQGVTLTESTVSENSTSGYYSSGGGISARGAVTLTASTVNGNSTFGAAADGGGIFAADGVTLTESTVSGNSTQGNGSSGGAIASFGESFGAVIVTRSTVTNNHSYLSSGGGISTLEDPIEINGSILAGNTADIGTPDLSSAEGPLTVNYSLVGTGVLPNGGIGTNIQDDDPGLGPLADNGGATLTHALLTGSPAIDAGDPDFTSPPEFDQRGTPFARVVDGDNDELAVVDIGAFELQTESPGLVGDYNGNGKVDAADYNVWRDAFGSSDDLRADGNGNGIIDAADYNLWRDNFGSTEAVSAGGAAVGVAHPVDETWALFIARGLATSAAVESQPAPSTTGQSMANAESPAPRTRSTVAAFGGEESRSIPFMVVVRRDPDATAKELDEAFAAIQRDAPWFPTHFHQLSI